jgi:hypothetical protein
MIPFASIA